MVTFRTLGFVLAVLLLIGWAVGYIHVNKDTMQCFPGSKHYQKEDWHTWFAVGSLEFRYKPIDYTCEDIAKYDTTQFKEQNGLLVPR